MLKLFFNVKYDHGTIMTIVARWTAVFSDTDSKNYYQELRQYCDICTNCPNLRIDFLRIQLL